MKIIFEIIYVGWSLNSCVHAYSDSIWKDDNIITRELAYSILIDAIKASSKSKLEMSLDLFSTAEAAEVYLLIGHENSILTGLNQLHSGLFHEALQIFEKSFSTSSQVFQQSNIMFYKGLSYERIGNFELSAESYATAITLNNKNVKAILNLSSILHRRSLLSEAISSYSEGIRVFEFPNEYLLEEFYPEYIMLQTNLALAKIQLWYIRDARTILKRLKVELLDRMHRLCYNDNALECTFLHESLSIVASHLMNIQRSVLDWNHWEENSFQFLNLTLHTIYQVNTINPSGSPMSPFESLLFPIGMHDRKVIANYTSHALYQTKPFQIDQLPPVTHRDGLRMGFISYDFNDHPTAHLLEGLFQAIHYGNDDLSSYRITLQKLATKFVDISGLNYEESSELIQRDQLDVLLDMQIHTIGNRLQISANRPAPIQVNYLVYPGTSGASFYQSIYVDAVVVPPEQAIHYSESLLMVPNTYQNSYYNEEEIHQAERQSFNDFLIDSDDDHAEYRRLMRRQILGVSDESNAILFCNFNKLDKLDPVTWHVWMSMLNRVNHSYLWLLEPPRTTTIETDSSHQDKLSMLKGNLLALAALYGIHPRRIIFATRVRKVQHIVRHIAADLFLDTIVYGAHSTATDALRGGLPVLTMMGDSFPNRVAASLLLSLESRSQFDLQYLVTYSVKEYEDTAVQLCNSYYGRQILSHFKNKLQLDITSEEHQMANTFNNNSILHSSLFSVGQNTAKFINSMGTLTEFSPYRNPNLFKVVSKIPNIVVAPT